MGHEAVERILAGESDVVVAERHGKIVTVDINYALKVDRMYKNKLKDGDLDKYGEEDLAAMKAICDKRRAEIEELYKIANDIAI
jgi:6-phosphofructokinase